MDCRKPLSKNSLVFGQLSAYYQWIESIQSSEPVTAIPSFDLLLALLTEESDLQLAQLADQIFPTLAHAAIPEQVLKDWILESVQKASDCTEYGVQADAAVYVRVFWEAKLQILPVELQQVYADRRRKRRCESRALEDAYNTLSPAEMVEVGRGKEFVVQDKVYKFIAGSALKALVHKVENSVVVELDMEEDATMESVNEPDKSNVENIMPSHNSLIKDCSDPVEVIELDSLPQDNATAITIDQPAAVKPDIRKKRKTDSAPKARTKKPKEDALAPEAQKNKLVEQEQKDAEKKRKDQEKQDREAAKKLKEEEREAAKKAKDVARELREQQREADKLEKEEKKRKDQEKSVEGKPKDKKAKKTAAIVKDQPRLTNFLVRSTPTKPKQEPEPHSYFEAYFRPFQVRTNSKLNLPTLGKFVTSLDIAEKDVEYVQNEFKKLIQPISFFPAYDLRPSGEMNVEPWKLIQFTENIRPALYCVLPKSKVLSGRNPFKLDPALDYEFDSEAEWEEEEPGEDIGSEDDEDEEEEMPQDEVDDGWLVPNGYLSDDEGDGLEDGKPAKEIEPAKRKILEPLVPLIVDPANTGQFSFDSYAVCFISLDYDTITGLDPFFVNEKEANKSKLFTDDLITALIQLIQWSDASMSKLVDEFKEQHQHLTKACIENKIRDIAIRERREGQTKWWIRTCSDEPNFQGLMENEANFNRKTRSTGRYLSAEQITEDPDDLYELLDSPKFAPQLLDEYQIQWLLHISNETLPAGAKARVLTHIGAHILCADKDVQSKVLKAEKNILCSNYDTLLDNIFIDIIDYHVKYDPENNIDWNVVNSSIYLATAHILAASLFPAEEVTSKFMRYIDIKEHVTDMWVDVLGELIEEPATNRSALCLNAALVCRKPRKFVTNFPDIDLGAHTKAYLAIFAPSAAISETVI